MMKMIIKILRMFFNGPAPLPIPIPIELLAFFIGIILKSIPCKDALNIAIFGSKGAGKTTLWRKLQGIFEEESYKPTLGVDNIEQFKIRHKGKERTISKSKDFSGDDALVKYYGEVIKEGTFIYYLIDLTTLEQLKKEIRARIYKILQIIKEKGLKDNKVGFRFVATHYKEYQKNNPGKDIANAKAELISILGLKDFLEKKDKRGVNIEDEIMVVELTEDNYIRQFYEQIVDC